MRNHLFHRLALLVVLIFLLNLAGSYFAWYNLLPWYDNLMHFLGGMWLSLLVLWFFFPRVQNLSVGIGIVLVFVLLGALLWEALEYSIQTLLYTPGLLATKMDSVSDVLFGIFGGLIAGLHFIKRIRKS